MLTGRNIGTPEWPGWWASVCMPQNLCARACTVRRPAGLGKLRACTIMVPRTEYPRRTVNCAMSMELPGPFGGCKAASRLIVSKARGRGATWLTHHWRAACGSQTRHKTTSNRPPACRLCSRNSPRAMPHSMRAAPRALHQRSRKWSKGGRLRRGRPSSSSCACC